LHTDAVAPSRDFDAKHPGGTMADQIRNSRFRYADADDLGHENIRFDDLDVRNGRGEKLGEVDGFIVDATSERPYYVVVESGGWFRGGKYLVPINHASLVRTDDETVMRVNLDKETIKQYPEFDKDEFARLSDAQLRDFETRLGRTCCPDEVASGAAWTYESWEHYREPDWWTTARRPADVARVAERPAAVQPVRTESRETRPLRERVVARDSQTAGDRAEPGDVLGIETGGEETHLGDTAADERRRTEISDREVRQAEKNNRG
jgi:hypothetical protein